MAVIAFTKQRAYQRACPVVTGSPGWHDWSRTSAALLRKGCGAIGRASAAASGSALTNAGQPEPHCAQPGPARDE